MHVQPRTQPIRNDLPFVRTPGFSDVRQTPYSVGPITQPAQRPASSRSRDETPPARGVVFSERELSRLCDARRLRIEDLRERNGNLWVLTGDADGYVSGQLRSWGFSFKAGKGWWRK